MSVGCRFFLSVKCEDLRLKVHSQQVGSLCGDLEEDYAQSGGKLLLLTSVGKGRSGVTKFC